MTYNQGGVLNLMSSSWCMLRALSDPVWEMAKYTEKVNVLSLSSNRKNLKDKNQIPRVDLAQHTVAFILNPSSFILSSENQWESMRM